MKHILTLTANPTLDLGGTVDNIKLNEKCYVHDQIKAPGGNGINAARILTRMKIPTRAIGFCGGSVGDEIKFLLNQEGVRNKFIRIQGHSRISVTVSNEKDHQQVRLNFPGPSVSIREKQALFHYIKQDQNIKNLIIGGSLPSGFQPADIVKILKIAEEKKIDCIVDCPGPILRQLITKKIFLIKPNLIEFQQATDSKVKSLSAVLKKAESLLPSIPYICVSSVERGALLVTREGSFFGRIPAIKIKSTVGAGDSMVGAMAAQIFLGNTSSPDLLRWGLAAAAATLSHSGTAMGTAQEIRTFHKKIKVRTL